MVAVAFPELRPSPVVAGHCVPAEIGAASAFHGENAGRRCSSVDVLRKQLMCCENVRAAWFASLLTGAMWGCGPAGLPKKD